MHFNNTNVAVVLFNAESGSVRRRIGGASGCWPLVRTDSWPNWLCCRHNDANSRCCLVKITAWTPAAPHSQAPPTDRGQSAAVSSSISSDVTCTTAASHLLLQRLKQPMSRTAKCSIRSCFHYNKVRNCWRGNNEAKSSKAAETESCSFTHHQIHNNRQIFTKSLLKSGFLLKKNALNTLQESVYGQYCCTRAAWMFLAVGNELQISCIWDGGGDRGTRSFKLHVITGRWLNNTAPPRTAPPRPARLRQLSGRSLLGWTENLFSTYDSSTIFLSNLIWKTSLHYYSNIYVGSLFKILNCIKEAKINMLFQPGFTD